MQANETERAPYSDFMDDLLGNWDTLDTQACDQTQEKIDEKLFDEAQEIPGCPGLWIGGLEPAKNKKWLESHNITHVLITGVFLPQFFPGEFEYMRVCCVDSVHQNLLSHFPNCLAFIDEGRSAGGVLVHCQYGVSRSATFCIAYVMARLELTFERAYDLIHAIRPMVDPNMGFIAQLRLFETMGLRVDVLDDRYKKLQSSTIM